MLLDEIADSALSPERFTREHGRELLVSKTVEKRLKRPSEPLATGGVNLGGLALAQRLRKVGSESSRISMVGGTKLVKRGSVVRMV